MLRQFSVTFEFDDETKTVSKLKCFQDGIEQKKPTTSRKKDTPVVLEENAIITLEPNKLVFNNKAANEMGILYQDRIIIKYDKIKGEKIPIPIIGTDVSFDSEGSGNKLTKGNTISYRGNANTILAEYGTEFFIEPYITPAYPSGIWRLKSSTDNNISQYEAILDSIDEKEEDITLIAEETDEIDEMTFKL
jgi:hypothetical protein